MASTGVATADGAASSASQAAGAGGTAPVSGSLSGPLAYSGTSAAILDATLNLGLSGVAGPTTSSSNGASANATDSVASNLPNYRYMVSDLTNLYFRVLPVAQMEQADLNQVLDSRKAYKKTLFANAVKLLEKNPDLPDLPGCTSAQDAASGKCAVVSGDMAESFLASYKSQGNAKSKAVASVSQIARKIAVVIGINQYDDKRIPQLIGAVPDSNAISQVLTEKLGYEVILLQNPYPSRFRQTVEK